MEMSSDELNCLTDEKISLGHELIAKLEKFNKIDGVNKVKRKILQELKFLCKIKQKAAIKIQHLNCCNLTFYNFLVESITQCENIKYVEYPLRVSNRDEPLKIDIVADNGRTWIKVIARNSKTINDVVKGRGEYGSKSILDQGEEFIQAAQENFCFFQPPKVVFKFATDINADLIGELERMGIHIDQPSLHLDEANDLSRGDTEYIVDKLNNKFYYSEINAENSTAAALNLDISTLIAYVSSLTNGGENYTFNEPLLNEQAKCEQTTHVKQILDQLFLNRQLICCETAIKSFNEIINMLGGPNESARATQLLERVIIKPDLDVAHLLNMKISGKIKQRSLLIFSFGLYHQAITVTSNEGFIRSAKMQGYDVPSFIHEARALTEIKENAI